MSLVVWACPCRQRKLGLGITQPNTLFKHPCSRKLLINAINLITYLSLCNKIACTPSSNAFHQRNSSWSCRLWHFPGSDSNWFRLEQRWRTESALKSWVSFWKILIHDAEYCSGPTHTPCLRLLIREYLNEEQRQGWQILYSSAVKKTSLIPQRERKYEKVHKKVVIPLSWGHGLRLIMVT